MAVARTDLPLRRALPLLAVACLLAACGTSGGDDASPTTAATTPTSTTERTSTGVTAPPDTPPVGEEYGEDDCPTAEAVAELFDVPLDQMMSFGGNFAGDVGTNATGCSYGPSDDESSDEDEVTIRRITTEAELSGTLFAALDKAAAKDARENGFSPIDGLGDEAYLDGQEVVMHVGDAIVFVEYDPSPAAAAGKRSAAEVLAADVAELDLDPASPPQCSDLRKLVREREGKITEAISHSGYLGFGDELTISSSGCAVTLADDTEVTISVAPDENWSAWVDDKKSSTFTTSYTATTVLDRKAFDDGDLLVVDDGTGTSGDSPYEIGVSGFGLDDAEAAARRVAVAELAIGG